MRKYILDISDIDRGNYSWLSDWPDQIEVTEGQHQKEFDVVGHAELQQIARDRLNKKYKDTIFTISNDWPIGFDLHQMPKGAKLEVIE